MNIQIFGSSPSHHRALLAFCLFVSMTSIIRLAQCLTL